MPATIPVSGSVEPLAVTVKVPPTDGRKKSVEPLRNVLPAERPVMATVGCDGGVVSTMTIVESELVLPTLSVPVSVKR